MEEKKIRSILYAGIVGDALGVPVEFSQRDTYYIDEMTSGGTWNQPAGTWSDDSSMTLALVKNLTEDGDYADLMDKFAAYLYESEFTPARETFDVGNGTRFAIRSYDELKMNPLECGSDDETANGNGAIMRLAPLAIELLDQDDLETRLGIIKDYTSMTHRHPRAIVGSWIYVEILRQLLLGKDLQSAIMIVDTQPHQVAFDPIYANEFQYYSRIFDCGFKELDREEIKSTGYVVDTLEAALWIALNYANFSDAVVTAVNLGEDTDTVGAIAATLAACEMSDVEIPNEWLGHLVNRELIDRIINPFIEKFAK